MTAACLSLLGLFDATYLALERSIGSAAMLCPRGQCAAVEASSYSELWGIPVAWIGMAGYLLLLVLALRSLHTERIGGISVQCLLLVGAGVGCLITLYLIWVQAVVLHSYCAWCMASALLMGGIGAAVVKASIKPGGR